DLQDRFAVFTVGQTDTDAAVETAGSQQRGVKDVGTVSSGQDNDVLTLFEAIHLDQDLVERLLAFVVASAHAGSAAATDGVDLVDKDDARSILLGLGEQVADTTGADTDEHFDE